LWEVGLNRFIKWARKEYPLAIRLISTLFAGTLFVLLIPLMLVTFGPAVDRTLSLSMPELGRLPLIVGIGLMIVGVTFALWSIGDQLIRARGTPLPIMATQKLLVSGPFKFCRNPMSFGTILMYLGLGITIRSPGTLTIVIVLSGLLLLYIRKVEEKELALRFGEEYEEYKSRTPFLVPWPFGQD
jgi:protein-S-isoprenylcysteine O-methyltransferase Ste14